MSNQKACLDLLESLNVCPRCCLRFLGEKKYTSYISKGKLHEAIEKLISKNVITEGDAESELASNNNHEQNPKRHLPTLCCTCLGILQDTCDTIVDQIDAKVKESGFQFSTFTLQLSLPVTVDLRQRLMFIYLKDTLGKEYNIAEADIFTVKEVWKRIVGFLYSEQIQKEFDPHGKFQITMNISHPDLVKECKKLFETVPEAFPNRKKRTVEFQNIFTRTAVLNAIDKLPCEKLKQLYCLPPTSPEKKCLYESISCTHSPLYLGGRYNKYSRELSQTPWIIDGERRMESSVQELIINGIEKSIVSDKIVFSASGREDVDVKMLGNGRPFVLEIINPRCSIWSVEQMQHIQNAINSDTSLVSVRQLQVISKDDLFNLKEGENLKRKTYSAICIVKKDLEESDIIKLKSVVDLEIKQATPVRVLHRRPLAVRNRMIHKIEAEIIGPRKIKILVETQAGTYVKEFVHGDFGRTIPNLGVLLNTEADILELDVLSIHLDWPPETND